MHNLISICCFAPDRVALRVGDEDTTYSERGECPSCGNRSEFMADRREKRLPFDGPYRRFDDALKQHVAASDATLEAMKKLSGEIFSGMIVGIVLTVAVLLALLLNDDDFKKTPTSEVAPRVSEVLARKAD